VKPEIVEYIRKYRDMYTRDAINNQLLAAGHDPIEIGAAWREVETGDRGEGERFSRWDGETGSGTEGGFVQPPRERPIAATWVFWACLVGTVVVSYGLGLGLVWLGASNPNTLSPLATAGLIAFLALQLAALILGIVSLNFNRARAFGFLIGVLMAVVVLPICFAAVLFGMCVTSLGPFGL
jgi:hypothetical protein